MYKLKKAVRLGFLDFTRLEDRRRFLQRELELNAPHAPGMYRDVVPIGPGPETGSLGFGSADPVDYVLRMAPVPGHDFLDRMAADGRLNPPLLDQVADAVAAMHAAQTPCGDPDAAGRMRRVIAGNAAAAEDAGLDAEGWRMAVLAALERRAPLLRQRAGLVRRAHGDLHLGNLLIWQGRPAPFDALEFDEDLATIDPAYDLAFLLMDLDVKVGRAAANRVLCRYVARTGDAGLVGVLPPFLSSRALIRAHVEARRGLPFRELLAAASAYLQPVRPALLAVGGLMGAGKSTLARALAPAVGPAPGALVLRSDEVRKRLFGRAPEQPLPPDAYTPEANARTNAALLDQVAAALRGGHAVIADATFLDPAQAVAIRAAAGPAPFLGLWLHAPLAELERRVAGRSGDASDAGVDVLRAAAAAAVPPPGWTVVDSADAGQALRQVQRAADLL